MKYYLFMLLHLDNINRFITPVWMTSIAHRFIDAVEPGRFQRQNDILRRKSGGNTLLFIYACIKRLCKYCSQNDRLDAVRNIESRQ